MRVLFVMQYPGYLRYYDSVVRLLAERGHEVVVAFENPGKQAEGLEALEGSNERIRVLEELPRPRLPWIMVARDIRRVTDYLRYLRPEMPEAEYLRRRMGALMPPAYRFLRRLEDHPRPRALTWLERVLGAAERALPSARPLKRFLRELKPDVVFVTPLVTDSSNQADLVRSAKSLGIPTIHGVASWDHLTTKGIIRILPDRIVVWNEVQRQEAQRLHGVPPELITVTGAQPFDRWFERAPSTTRAEFCERVGLPPDKPFLLFVGSTESISKPGAELKFVREWIRALRKHSSAQLGEIAVMVRPHPYNAGHWLKADLSSLGDVVVWPRGRANPVSEDNRSTYFDSMYHSAAVVGINTSAMLESAIVGRSVFTVRSPRFVDSQDGTIHFHYLLDDNGGPVRVASSLRQHARQLEQTLADPDAARRKLEDFVGSFIRPHGIANACVPLVVDEIEQLAEAGPRRRVRMAPHRYLLRPVLWLYGVVRLIFDMRGHGKRIKRRSKGARLLCERIGAALERGGGHLGRPGARAGAFCNRGFVATGRSIERVALRVSKRLMKRAAPVRPELRHAAPDKDAKPRKEREKVA